MSDCQRCNSERIIHVYSHGKDLQNVEAPYLDYEHEGYLPKLPNIGYDDDVEIVVCLECGQLQGEWPVSDSVLREEDDDDDDDDDPGEEYGDGGPRISDAEREQRQLDYLATLPDNEETIPLSERFYDMQRVMDPNSSTMQDGFNDKLKEWLLNNIGCYSFDEEDGDFGSLTFINAVGAVTFANHFDLTFVSDQALKHRINEMMVEYGND